MLTPITVFLCLCSFIFALGFYTGTLNGKPEIIFRDKIKWQDKIIYRDYKNMSREKALQQLACFDTARPTLDIKKLNGDLFQLSAGLCEREWTRDVKIKCGTSGNWKFYAGAGVAGLLAGILLMK